MSRRLKIWLAVVAVTGAAVVPASDLSVLSAGASTAACGSSCTSPSNESLGTGEVVSTNGVTVSMAAASTTNPDEDWTPEQEGDVTNAVSAGVMDSRLQMLYGTDPVLEFQYAPSGVPSNECLAYTSLEPGTEQVAMATCGVTSATLWIVDQNNEANGYVDLISASYTEPVALGNSTTVTPYAEPGVLTVSSGKVTVTPLSALGGVVSHAQLWLNWSSPAQVALRTKAAKSHRP